MRNTALKIAILETGGRQYELAARAMLSETRLSRIACGRAAPSLEERRRIAGCLGVPESDLFPEIETKPAA